MHAKILIRALCTVGVSITVSSYAAPSIVLDGSLGPKTPLAGPSYNITADLGQTRGANLFHSFSQFNLIKGETANFAATAAIANILARVTGGEASSIDGTIRTTGTSANLYLLNPGGIMFGPNSTLNVGGAFHVSTADYIKFGSGEKFFADPANTGTILSVASPTAFGFLGASAPAPISLLGGVSLTSIKVSAGQILSVIGGDITIQKGAIPNLSAPGGQVQVASVASGGEVVPTLSGGQPDLNVDSFTALGRVSLLNNATIDASAAASSASGSGGTVLIRAGQLVLDAKSRILTTTRKTTDGALVGIDVKTSGNTQLTNGSTIQSTTSSSGSGRPGDVRIRANGIAGRWG